jgi:RHS repeat-associated protein
MDGTPATNGSLPVVTSPSGDGLKSPSGTLADRNGNYITKVVVNSSETDYTDSTGIVALRVINSASPLEVDYKFLDASGNTQTIRLVLAAKNVKTNFACSSPAVGDYTSTGQINLPTELDIPSPTSGTLKYTFTYEQTPGNASYTTGRVQKVTLPSGGSYEWDYTGSNDGINCADGTVLGLNETVSDGTNTATWNFVRNASSLTTTVTTPGPPALPDVPNAYNAVYTFNSSGQEISRVVYGESPGVHAKRTVNTTWATNGTPSTTLTILEDNTKAETDTTYDSNGLLDSLTEYDWGSGAHGSASPIRTTTYSYLTNSNYTSRNLISLMTSKVLKDGSGATQYRIDIAYDGVGLANCPPGQPQHDDTNYACSMNYRGNPTAVTVYQTPGTPTDGITKNFTYDVFGNLLTALSGSSTYLTRTFTPTTKYSQPDSVTKGISPTQLTTNYLYNLNIGLVIQATDSNNLITIYSYDFLRRPTSISQTGGGSVTYTYSDVVPLATTTTTAIDSSKFVKVVSQYDGLGNISSSTTEDNSGNPYSVTNAKHDLLGRAYQTSNPYTGTAQYWATSNFDVLGRLTSVVLPDNSTTSYLYTGQTLKATDPAGKLRQFQRDAAGRLVAVTEPDANNNLNLTTSYTYNVLNELTSVTQGSQTRTYIYDNIGRLFTATSPESGTTCFGTVASGSCKAMTGYDNFNNLLYRTDARGVLASYTYDGLNRLTGVSSNVGNTGVPATASVSFAYGSSSCTSAHGAGCIGQPITMTDGVGSENYTYNGLEQMTQIQKVLAGTTFTTNFSYDFSGDLTQITYPSGRVVQQSLDAIGRPCEFAPSTTGCGTSTSPYATGYQYNAAGLVTDFKYGNGIFASVGFSGDRLQLNCLDYSTTNRNHSCIHDSTTKFGLTYSYGTAGSNNGQIASITDYIDNGRSVAYTYDTLSRLSTAITTGSTSYPQWGLQESYDRYGNRSGQSAISGKGCVAPMTCPQTSVTIDQTTNRISGDCYDADGNLLGETAPPCPAPTYTYDAENRLVNYMSSNPTYIYDGNSLRVKKCQPNCASPTSTTIYIFAGTKVIAEYDNGAAVASPSREYIYGAGTLLAKIDSSGTKYYHQDHLSNRMVTSLTGSVVAQMGHFPFGESWYNATNDKKLFTTYERDSESSNDYAIARYDMARLGRFSSPDPLAGHITNPQSLNRYAYALDDPCNLVDPLGLKCTLIFGLNDGSLSDATKKKISDIFENAGVGVQFVSGNGDFNIQQDVPIAGGSLGNANFKEGIAEVNNPGILSWVKMNNLDDTISQANDSALGIVISHELGHLTTNCVHNPTPGPGYTDCGGAQLMRPGPEQTDAFLDPSLLKDPTQIQFTPKQAKTIQETCEKKHPQKPPAPSHGGGGGGIGVPVHGGNGGKKSCVTDFPYPWMGGTFCDDGSWCLFGPAGTGCGVGEVLNLPAIHIDKRKPVIEEQTESATGSLISSTSNVLTVSSSTTTEGVDPIVDSSHAARLGGE